MAQGRTPVTRAGEAARAAVFAAAGLPAAVLFFSMAGYGSMCREFGLPFPVVFAGTPLIWGLPGQVTMAEMTAAGAPVLAVAAAVSAANARFMPMVMALLPHMRAENEPWWRPYLAAQFTAVNTWTSAMREFPALPRRFRHAYYFSFVSVCVAASAAGTAAGYFSTGVLPRPVTLGLVFLNPVYFALILADARLRAGVLAAAFGAPLGPLMYQASPEWGLPLSGLIAGTAAFAVDAALRARETGAKAGEPEAGEPGAGEQ